MLMPAEAPEETEEPLFEEEVPEMDAGGDDPAELLAQALAEHGPDDPGRIIEWLQEYGYELTPSDGAPDMGPDMEEPDFGDEGLALGGEELPDGGNEAILESMDEGPEEGPPEPGESMADSRKSAASRAFGKHYGGQGG